MSHGSNIGMCFDSDKGSSSVRLMSTDGSNTCTIVNNTDGSEYTFTGSFTTTRTAQDQQPHQAPSYEDRAAFLNLSCVDIDCTGCCAETQDRESAAGEKTAPECDVGLSRLLQLVQSLRSTAESNNEDDLDSDEDLDGDDDLDSDDNVNSEWSPADEMSPETDEGGYSEWRLVNKIELHPQEDTDANQSSDIKGGAHMADGSNENTHGMIIDDVLAAAAATALSFERPPESASACESSYGESWAVSDGGSLDASAPATAILVQDWDMCAGRPIPELWRKWVEADE